MELFKNLLTGMKQHEILLLILLVTYIVFNVRTPETLAKIISENILAQGVVYLIALSLFRYSKPVIGVLGLIAAYELVQRSKQRSGRKAVQKYLPSQDKMNSALNAFNQFPPTLEEEVVATMAPIVRNGPVGAASFVPILDNIGFSAPIDYDGVI
jgi:hypothetical protein